MSTGSSPNDSKPRPPSGVRMRLMVGASSTSTPLLRASAPSADASSPDQLGIPGGAEGRRAGQAGRRVPLVHGLAADPGRAVGHDHRAEPERGQRARCASCPRRSAAAPSSSRSSAASSSWSGPRGRGPGPVRGPVVEAGRGCARPLTRPGAPWASFMWLGQLRTPG